MGPADEEVSPQEALVEGGDVEDPLEEVALQMDPAKSPPYTFQLHSLLSSFSPPFLIFLLLFKWVVPLNICKELTALFNWEVSEYSEAKSYWWSLVVDSMHVLRVVLVTLTHVCTKPVLVLRASSIKPKWLHSEQFFVRDGFVSVASHQLPILMSTQNKQPGSDKQWDESKSPWNKYCWSFPRTLKVSI